MRRITFATAYWTHQLFRADRVGGVRAHCSSRRSLVGHRVVGAPAIRLVWWIAKRFGRPWPKNRSRPAQVADLAIANAPGRNPMAKVVGSASSAPRGSGKANGLTPQRMPTLNLSKDECFVDLVGHYVLLPDPDDSPQPGGPGDRRGAGRALPRPPGQTRPAISQVVNSPRIAASIFSADGAKACSRGLA
jgi:hypothetical protein